MLAQACARAAMAMRPAASAIQLIRRGAVASVVLVIAGCSPPPPVPLAGPDPADPQARVPGVAYRSAVGPYVGRRPVEPSSWQDQNDQTAPASVAPAPATAAGPKP